MKRVSEPETKSEILLPKIEPLPGTVCAQMVRCGRSNCKCAKGQLHGPYHYRFFYMGGRLHKTYVKKGDLQAVWSAVSAYKQQRIEQRRRRLEALELARQITQYNRGIGKLLKLVAGWG